MDVGEFREILTAFADRPANVDLSGHSLMVEIRDELIEGRVSQRPDGLWVEENGATQRAEDWVFKRIARLPTLADRILTYVQEEPHFVEPAGKKLDRMEKSPRDMETSIDAVTEPILSLLDERPPEASTGVYLTCDAGEGKTTLIHHLARRQAQRYRNKETSWLLVPIALGGRPFLRFDEVFIGTLVNRLRFPFLYYNALVWLVRKGAIVPALDGFEEMFVESAAGDAVSALGNLVSLLDSRGTILIAARTAYFEYKDLRTQSALFDSFRGQNADFVRVHLSRWDRDRFVEYAKKRSVSDGGKLFTEVAEQLDDTTHPLLTRPVLVKRLIDIASDRSRRDDLVKHIRADGDLYFERFVESIIRREARHKWIDRSGVAAHPLLTELQHSDLLSEIASEMWTSDTTTLSSDVFDYIADVYVEDQHMDAQITRQVHQRIRQHALITTSERENYFQFDHDEFFHYFLGEAIARVVTRGDMPELRRMFRIAQFPEFTIEVATRRLRRNDNAISTIVDTLNSACSSEPYASFVKTNAGSLVVRLIDSSPHDDLVIKRMHLSKNSLRNKQMLGVKFLECNFESTELSGSTIDACVFERCQFEQLDVSRVARVRQSTLRDYNMTSIVRSSDGAAFLDLIRLPRCLGKLILM